jgi:hypothetical protein
MIISMLYLTLLSFNCCCTSTQNKVLAKVMLKFIATDGDWPPHELGGARRCGGRR